MKTPLVPMALGRSRGFLTRSWLCHDPGVLYFYLQDIIVKPTYRGQQIGREIVAKLTEEALSRAEVGATIGLMSAKGKEAFYGHFGFQERPDAHLGAGMTLFVLPQ